MRELFVRKLTKRERDFVYALINNKKFGYRGLIIAMSYEGYPVSVIWKRLNVHPVNVRKWIRWFNRYGIDGIKPKKVGKKRVISSSTEDRILCIALTKPTELGLHFSTWSLRKLRAYLIKKKIVKGISHTQIARILKSRKLGFKKSKLQLISEDPEYEAKMARIKRLLKRPNCVVLFEDEKTIVAKRYIGYEWCFVSQIVRKNQKIKGKATMFAAYEPHRRKIYAKYFDGLTKENFKKFLDYLNCKFDEDVYLILDNHRSHWVGERYRKIKFVFLPTAAPKLNQMDTQFSVMQREVLSNSAFSDILEVERAIDRWIRIFNRRSK